MTDRGLLELAARAAGFGKSHYENGDWLEIRYGLTEAIWSDEHEGYWNPLEDDGDALRLAVKLDISVRQLFAAVTAEYPWIEDYCTRKTLCEGVLDDYCAATRRAIVRAAAAIGRKIDAQPESAD